MPDPRYPIGPFQYIPFENVSARQAAIAELRNLPALVRQAVANLTDAQLDTPYRTGGWTIRQLVHHIADSHLNAYTRFRLALTEDKPTIKPYDEVAWANLPDSHLPLAPSLSLLDNLHHRLTVLLELTPEAAFAREVIHPDSGTLSLDKLLQLYAWHGRHHLAHITHAPLG
ncbi:MAG: putative metal-dependent hydrolase [Bryobacter sp.]|nr:putative metal-dependent hydrolase [Bryobacter sp.]